MAHNGENLGDGNNEEGPSSTSFDDDGDELGVDRGEGTVPRHPGHPDVVDAVLRLPCLRKDVAELALPDHTPERHRCGERGTTRRMELTYMQQN